MLFNEESDSPGAQFPGLEGTSEPMGIAYTIYQVIERKQDPRAPALLERMQTILRGQMLKIDDVELQQAFVTNIKVNKAILNASGQVKAQPTG